MAIHINPKNKGKFTAYKKRTGKSTSEALHSKNPHVRAMANFARNAKKFHHGKKHEDGGYAEFAEGGMMSYHGSKAYSHVMKDPRLTRRSNPDYNNYVAGNVGSQKGMAQFNARGSFADGGELASGLSGAAGVLGAIPTPITQIAGAALGLLGGITAGNEKKKAEEDAMHHQAMQEDEEAQANIGKNKPVPTFADGGGNFYFANSYVPFLANKVEDKFPGKENKANVVNNAELRRFAEGGMENNFPIYNAANMKAHFPTFLERIRNFKFADGGLNPGLDPNIEVEGGEMTQGPDGSMQPINGPSHAEGGVPVAADPGTRIYSDKLKASTGKTFADEAKSIQKKMAKYEKMLGK